MILLLIYIIGFFISLFGMLYIFRLSLDKKNTQSIILYSLLSWLMIIVCIVVYYFDLEDDDNDIYPT